MAKQNPTYNLLDLVKVLNGNNHYSGSDMWRVKNRAKNMANHFENGEVRFSKNDDLNMTRLRKLGRMARERQSEKKDLGKKNVTDLRNAIAKNLKTIYRANRPIYDASQFYEMLTGVQDNSVDRFEQTMENRQARASRLENAIELLRKGRHNFTQEQAADIKKLISAANEMSSFGVDASKVDEFRTVLGGILDKNKIYDPDVRGKKVPRRYYDGLLAAIGIGNRECTKENIGLGGLFSEAYEKLRKNWNAIYNTAKVGMPQRIPIIRDMPVKKKLTEAANGIVGRINQYIRDRKEKQLLAREAAQFKQRSQEESKIKIYKQIPIRATSDGRLLDAVSVEKGFTDYFKKKNELRSQRLTEQDLLARLTPKQVEQYAQIKHRFVGSEAYEQLLKAAAYNELRNEANAEVRAKAAAKRDEIKDSLTADILEARWVTAELKKQEQEKEKRAKQIATRDKALDIYRKHYASENGKQLGMYEMDVITRTCKKVGDGLIAFKDEGREIMYVLSGDEKAAIRQRAKEDSTVEAGLRQRALIQGLYREAEDYFAQKDAFNNYLSRNESASGERLTFDQFRTIRASGKRGIDYQKGTTADGMALEGLTYKAEMNLADGTGAVSAELSSAEAGKIRVHAFDEMTRQGKEDKAEYEKLVESYAKRALRNKLVKNAEKLYTRVPVPAQVAIPETEPKAEEEPSEWVVSGKPHLPVGAGAPY